MRTRAPLAICSGLLFFCEIVGVPISARADSPAAKQSSAPSPAPTESTPTPSTVAQIEPETPSGRGLTLEESLSLAIKNNRDLQAARERLRLAHTDVEKALAALWPTVNFQGKLTVNEPVVSLSLDQSGSVFTAAYQGAQLRDVNGGTMGPNAAALYQIYCKDPNQAQGVQAACQMLGPQSGSDPIQALNALNAAINSSNITATIVPRLQLDGVLSANLPLIVPAAYPAYKGTKLNFNAQEKQLEVTTIQILTSVATSFYAAAGNDELCNVSQNSVEVAQKTLDNARVRLAAGVVNRVDVSRAEQALVEAEQRLLEARAARYSAYRMLATLLLIEPSSFKVVPPSTTQGELDSADQLIDKALHQNPELLTLQFQDRAFGQQVFSSFLRWSPTLSAFGSIRLTNATGFAGRVDSYAAGLQLDWLLFDGFSRDAQRHAFEAQQRETRLRLEQRRATLTDDVIIARGNVVLRQQGLRASQRAVELARETQNVVETQYQAGTVIQLELLNAQDRLRQADQRLVQARFDLSLAVLNLKRLIGDNIL